MDKLLTWDEAAERLNTTPRHLRRLVFERRIAYRKLGRYVRFHPDDLEEYISANRVEVGRLIPGQQLVHPAGSPCLLLMQLSSWFVAPP